MKSAFVQTIIQTLMSLTSTPFPTPAHVNLLEQYQEDTQSREVGPSTVTEQNEAVLAQLKEWKPTPVAGRLDSLTRQQANEVLREAMTDPVAAKHQLAKYDPKGNIGFCFGRAMWLHLELLRRGVNKHSIFKAFVVGDMLYNKITWQFHVATLVRADNGDWWILDPEFQRLLTLSEWFAYNQAMSPDKKLRLYITEANKFGASAEEYKTRALEDGWYNSYFKDMLEDFREDAADGRDRFGDAPLCRSLFKGS